MANDYSTHLPILEGLSNLLDLRNVLEFGAGLYSTPFFLSIPKLERLVSVETDWDWRERVMADNSDPRLSVVARTDSQPYNFDLILIDDGHEASEREQTIRSVLGQKHPPVVIHDAEVPEYRQAIRELSEGRSLLFCLEKPHTALIWPEGWPVSRHAVAQEVSKCVS